ncbi:MAG: DUF362 domain-containing protein [Calditrichaeota bacterium]|nr:DUF362 domain-containing protein [Calditrichota bacterium]
MDRRKFLKYSLAIGSAVAFLEHPFHLFASTPEAVRVSGAEPPELLRAALGAFGGIQSFVSRGDVVVIKPNIGWDRTPEQAATTNPILIGELVKSCYDAGAKKVKVFDRTCNNPRRCYQNSAIQASAEQFGAEVEQIRDFKFRSVSLPEGEILKEWPIYKDYLEADKVINVPVAKHHSMSRVTLGLKNLMGIMGGNRGAIHNRFSEKINDISAAILPSLTIIDAYRILLRNGPSGGNMNDVKLTKTLIMSPCTVSADVLSLDLFDRKLEEVPYIREAINRGMNKYKLETLNVKRIQLS